MRRPKSTTMDARWKPLRAALLAVLSVGSTWLPITPVAGQQKVDFASQIRPILQERCWSCHGGDRPPKAGLRLDGKEWILKGSKNGKVVVPGKPERSSLYTLTTLDDDDEDLMPAKGKRLTKSQTALLEKWITLGADFGSWTGASTPRPTSPTAGVAMSGASPWEATLVRISGDLDLAPESALVPLVSLGAKISPVIEGRPLLRVQFSARAEAVEDRTLRALAGIQDHVTDLDLSRTQVGNLGLELVAGMKRLTRLNLHHTAVTDAGLKHLLGLPELQSLNLYATKVSDEGLSVLDGVKSLRTLYVWQSGVTEEGVRAFAERRPDVRVSWHPEFPEVRAEPQTNRRRRRQ